MVEDCSDHHPYRAFACASFCANVLAEAGSHNRGTCSGYHPSKIISTNI